MVNKYSQYGEIEAVTINNNIYLKGTIKDIDEETLRHELMHVRQFQTYGIYQFTIRYLWYLMWYGYVMHPMENEYKMNKHK